MKSESQPPKARRFLQDLASAGRYDFTSGEARSALGLSAPAAAVALNRLAKQGAIVSPARGFYLIVPPEYRPLGCLPAEQFVPALMQKLKLPYYAGLLTAAQYYGAAHQRPQEFQVFAERRRRPIVCGRVRVTFVMRQRLRAVPVQSFNTPRGALAVSTAEATALDLVGYQNHVGGLDHVARVLAELAERIDPAKLAAAADTAPLPWAQRLGYLLERVDAAPKAVALRDYVRARAHESALLLPNAPRRKARRSEAWKLFINAAVEIDA
jgi:predicted transcriptional regulator of viral defense system